MRHVEIQEDKEGKGRLFRVGESALHQEAVGTRGRIRNLSPVQCSVDTAPAAATAVLRNPLDEQRQHAHLQMRFDAPGQPVVEGRDMDLRPLQGPKAALDHRTWPLHANDPTTGTATLILSSLGVAGLGLSSNQGHDGDASRRG